MNEPVPPKEEVVCPAWLLPQAQKAWSKIAPMLENLGLLSCLDISALAGYCQSYAHWKDAKEQVAKSGSMIRNTSGKQQRNPYVFIASKSLAIMKSLCAEFGVGNEMILSLIADEALEDNAVSTDCMEKLLRGGWKRDI